MKVCGAESFAWIGRQMNSLCFNAKEVKATVVDANPEPKQLQDRLNPEIRTG